jgi:hypothetical protein
MRYYPRMGDIEVISFDLWHGGRTQRARVVAAYRLELLLRLAPLARRKSKGDPRRPRPWKDINDQPGANRRLSLQRCGITI